MEEEFSFSDFELNAIDTHILNKTPAIIPPKGRGKRSFIVSIPPFRKKLKGFGLLRWNSKHHIFHSVLGLIRYFGFEYKEDDNFLNHLTKAASLCGTAHITKSIPVYVIPLANSIRDEVTLFSLMM